MVRFHGKPKHAAAPAQFILEAASMKSPQLSATFRSGKFPNVRLCWSRSRVFLTKLAPHKMGAADLEKSNPNLAGGDINGGAANLTQLIARPVFSPTPYRTPLPSVYLCSASTPPGGGVHGMCGYHAARAALRDHFSVRKPA